MRALRESLELTGELRQFLRQRYTKLKQVMKTENEKALAHFEREREARFFLAREQRLETHTQLLEKQVERLIVQI